MDIEEDAHPKSNVKTEAENSVAGKNDTDKHHTDKNDVGQI